MLITPGFRTPLLPHYGDLGRDERSLTCKPETHSPWSCPRDQVHIHHHHHCHHRPQVGHAGKAPFYLDRPDSSHQQPSFPNNYGSREPQLSNGQTSYLDQLQNTDQKKQAAATRLQQMGFSKAKLVGAIGGVTADPGAPAGTEYWSRTSPDFKTVKLLPDGTIAPHN